MAAGIPGRCRPAFRNESGRDSEMKAATYSDFKAPTFSGFFGTVADFVFGAQGQVGSESQPREFLVAYDLWIGDAD